MANDKTTDVVKPAKDLLYWLIDKLETYDTWFVDMYSGTDSGKVFNSLSTMQLPVAIVMYKGSSFSDEVPCRTSNFSVYLAVEDFGNFYETSNTVDTLLRKVSELLDHELYDNVLFKVMSETSIELGINVVAYEISVIAEDY